MLHWDEEGGRWVEGGLTYNVSYKAADTSGIAFQAVRLTLYMILSHFSTSKQISKKKKVSVNKM